MAKLLTETALSGVEQEAENVKLPRGKKKFKKVWLLCWLFVLLPIFGYFFFNAFPIVISFVSMFMDLEHNRLNTMTWNNFANFKQFFQDSTFTHSLGITFWLMLSQPLSLLIGFTLSVLLYNVKRFQRLFQIIFFIPGICSTVASSVMWRTVFAGSESGVLNSILGTNINWLWNYDNPATLTWCIFIVVLWSSPGYGIVMYLATLKGVDRALYEAADLDGASGWQKVRFITLPLLAPMTFFLLLSGYVAGMNIFDQVTIFAPAGYDGTAGIDDMGKTMQYYIYIQGMTWQQMEYASVLCWVMNVIVFIPSFILLKLRQRAEDKVL